MHLSFNVKGKKKKSKTFEGKSKVWAATAVECDNRTASFTWAIFCKQGTSLSLVAPVSPKPKRAFSEHKLFFAPLVHSSYYASARVFLATLQRHQMFWYSNLCARGTHRYLAASVSNVFKKDTISFPWGTMGLFSLIQQTSESQDFWGCTLTYSGSLGWKGESFWSSFTCMACSLPFLCLFEADKFS